MQFLIITGMSGAGKSRAMAVLEDLDFYCVDNLPVSLIPQFAEVCLAAREQYSKVALVMDVRVGSNLTKLIEKLENISNLGCKYQILFLDANTNILVNRYKETRRKHPLSVGGISFSEAIAKERNMLTNIRHKADFVIDTTSLSTSALKTTIINMIQENREKTITVSIMSFGFKYGVPDEADLMFDVRFLPNPYYQQDLRNHKGLEKPVQDYVMLGGVCDEFTDRLYNLIDFLIPKYIEEGKVSLTIAIGCTGGRHRSVTVCEFLSNHLKSKNYICTVIHRDIERG